ncbi:MAG: hypothetical protein WC136_08365 [Sphaerochaeta sp.]|jgi:hypothetical protein
MNTQIQSLIENLGIVLQDLKSRLTSLNYTNSANRVGGLIDYINTGFQSDLYDLNELLTTRGKDILIMADQANIFICVGLDSVERLIDTYLYSMKAEEDLVPIVSNLNSQLIVNPNEAHVVTTLNDLETRLVNLSTACKKGVQIVDVYKDVLNVNTTVGITLSVSPRALKNLEKLGQSNYKTITTDLGNTITSSTSTTLESNELCWPIIIDSKSQILLAMISCLSDTSNYEEVRIFNKKDQLTLDLHSELIDPQPLSIPDVLVSRYNTTAFYNSLNIDNILNEIDARFDVVNDFEFTKEEVLAYIPELENFRSQVMNGLLINNYVEYYNDLKQNTFNTLLISSLHETIGYTSNLTENIVFRPQDSQILLPLDLINNILNIEYYNYMMNNDLFQMVSEQFPNEITKVSQSGEIQVYLGNNVKIDKMLKKYKYHYTVYKDLLNIRHGIFQIAGYNIVYTNNKLYVNLKHSEKIGPFELRELFEHDLSVIYDLVGLFDDGVQNTTITANTFSGRTNYTKHIVSEYKVIDKTIERSTQVDDNVVVTSSSNSTEKVTQWITNNRVESTSTMIATQYRLEVHEDRLSSTEARNKSMLLAIQTLGLREKLESFINETWLAEIPRS